MGVGVGECDGPDKGNRNNAQKQKGKKKKMRMVMMIDGGNGTSVLISRQRVMWSGTSKQARRKKRSKSKADQWTGGWIMPKKKIGHESINMKKLQKRGNNMCKMRETSEDEDLGMSRE